MMKKTVLLLVSMTVISGCVGQNVDVLQSIMDVGLVGGGAEDVTVTAKIPEFARKNTDFGWQLVVQPLVDIKDFNTTIYDTGLFTVVNASDLKRAKILANRTEIFDMKYTMGDPGLAEKTGIRMRSFYKSNATISTTVAVLSETEYFQRRQQGTLGGIPVSTWTSTNPLQLTITWSDMPLLEKQEVQMYVNYQNLGKGFIEKLGPGEVRFKVPSNLAFVSCDDYNMTNGELILKRDLDFVQKTAKKSTCVFTAVPSGPITSSSIVGTALYTYEVDSTVEVPIIQK